MTPDEIKLAAQKLKKTKNELDQRDIAVSSLIKLGDVLKTKVRDAIATNEVAVLTEVVETAISTIGNYDDTKLIQAIDKQTESLKDKTSLALFGEIKKLINEVGALKTKTYFDQDAFDRSFTGFVEKIINIVVGQNEIPSNTTYQRNGPEGKISKVIEKYDNYTLTHTWAYNSDAKLVNVETTRNETS